MRNFTYRSLDEKDNIEAVLRQRKKKINRQQIIAGIIIFIIVSLATMYAIDKSFYTEYDAYIHIEINKVRAPYDIYLDSVYVKPGDIVHIGDTLYSYYVLDWLVLEINPNDEPSVLQNKRSITLQLSDIEQKIRVLEVRIAELKKQIALESHNISFGLSNNSHKMDLERELKEAEALLAALRAQLGVITGLKHDAEFGPRGPNRARKGGSQIYENPYSKSDAYDIRYNISNKDGFITDVMAPTGMIFFEKEDIIDMQHLDLKDNNLMVVAYVPVNLTGRIKDNMPAKIYVNDELNFDAHVMMVGVRSEDIPENLRSYFAKANKALIALLNIDEGQIIPFWSATSGLPVKVKIRNLFPWEDEPEAHRVMTYEVGKGLRLQEDDGVSSSAEVYDMDSSMMLDSSTPKKPAAKESATKKNQDKAEPKKESTVKAEPKTEAPAKAESKTKAPATVESKKDAAPKTEPKKSTAGQQPAAGSPQYARYMSVLGVFSEEKRARAYIDDVKKDGFNCQIIKFGQKWFVFFSSAESAAKAYAETSKIRKSNPTKYEGIWILDTSKYSKKK
ncbi:MAG: hypothetical protein K2H72_04700 [Muribaculaceae bacterium]|nr:hypothetical protein [Muribaculaceae bacterium]